MTFWARFRYYLIGVSIGVVVSFFFFRGRGCAWLPENRVKNELVASVILYDVDIQCRLKCVGLEDEDIFSLLESGSVLFSESKPNDNPKVYVLEGKSKAGKDFKLHFSLKDTISRVVTVEGSDDCDCKEPKEAMEIKLPEATAKKLVASRPLDMNDLASCQKDCYDFSDEELEKLIGDANFMEAASSRRKHPHPELFFENNGYEIVIEITKETSRIINIVKLDNPDCGCY